MDAAEGSKSRKDNQVVFLNWKLAKPWMRFRNWLSQSGGAPPHSQKHFLQNPNMGSVGSPQRLEFAAIGSTVNIASRIQGLTKAVGRPLLVTEAVRERSADSFAFEERPPQEVRGIEGRDDFRCNGVEAAAINRLAPLAGRGLR